MHGRFRLLLIIGTSCYLQLVFSQDSTSQKSEPCGKLGQLLRYPEFSLQFDSEHKQPFWVAYTLEKSELDLPAKARKSYFKADTNIQGGSATLADYKGKGYDRGHMSRAEFNKRSLEVYKQSFLMSNMCPQEGKGFNQTGGLWNRSEIWEMELCHQFKTLYNVSGPIYGKSIKTIGTNKVLVPEAFFKVIVYQDEHNQWQGIGLIMPNKSDKKTPVINFLVSINEIENKTGLDFNCHLLTELIEKQVEYTVWQTSR